MAVLAAALGISCPGRTNAADLTIGKDTILFFSGIDLWRHGAFTHAGALWGPNGIDRDGFVFKLSGGAGSYRYHSGALAADVTGRTLSFSALPGWRFRRGSFILTGFAGLEIQHHEFSPDDVSNALRGTNIGARGALEIWYEPTANSMIAADMSATNIGPSYSARGAAGWRVFDKFYVGPEVAAFTFDETYRQWRAGMHVTGLRNGIHEWSAGAGWSRDSDGREDFYARLGLIVRFSSLSF